MNKDIEKKIKLILNVILDEIETNEKFQKRFLEIFDINPDKELKTLSGGTITKRRRARLSQGHVWSV